MKKLFLYFVVLSSLMCVACGSNDSEGKSETTTLKDASSQKETTTEDLESFIYLKSGAWLANGAGEYQYYIFNNDGETGSVIKPGDGTTTSFRFETNDDKVLFYFGKDENAVPAVVEQDKEDEVLIKWQEGTQETLTYLSSDTADTFVFYTDEKLCEMALSFYKKSTNEDTSALQAAAKTEEDGMVSIQLYTNLEDHNSTAQWYKVSRLTATGTDGSGKEVDLR